jgi:serine/threonine protein phosphatase PrpC
MWTFGVMKIQRLSTFNNNRSMAQAFEDFFLKNFGVISVREVTYRHLTSRDQFIVLAMIGVWDVLSNQEVASIVSCAPSRVAGT